MFVRDTRDNGEVFYRLDNDAPEWLHGAVREAHKGDMPDDWIYEQCANAFDAYKEGSLDPDDVHSYADSAVEVYTRELFAWAADFCLSTTYSDAEECAKELCAFTDRDSVQEILSTIQYCAITFIAQTIAQACRDNEADQ